MQTTDPGTKGRHLAPRRGFRGAGFGVEVWIADGEVPRRDARTAAHADERAERRRVLRELRQALAGPPFWDE